MLKNITITNIDEIFTVRSLKGRFETIKNRGCYGISFCCDGQITYTQNKIKTISDKSRAIILPKGGYYAISGDKTGDFPVINFTCTENFCSQITSLPLSDNASYIKDFEKMRSLSLFDGNRAEIMSIFYHMLHRLGSTESESSIILPAVKYLEQNYQNPNLTNTELAAVCNISEVYFRRIFTKRYKTTPKQYLIDVKINKAKQLLCEGALKICAVASQCGFSNQYHFCRTFKEKTGLTPTEYMEQNKIYKI